MKHDRQSVEEYKMLTSMLKAEHPKAHSAWRTHSKEARSFLTNISWISDAWLSGSFFDRNPILGVGLLGYEMLNSGSQGIMQRDLDHIRAS